MHGIESGIGGDIYFLLTSQTITKAIIMLKKIKMINPGSHYPTFDIRLSLPQATLKLLNCKHTEDLVSTLFHMTTKFCSHLFVLAGLEGTFRVVIWYRLCFAMK